ncbi:MULTISPECIES: hypothetical protein [Acidianus]|nr:MULTISPECIES: hypothetical protein [Acidianus]NON61746.1 hypothetical protein [Acidianus sp. RZ1]
MDKRSIILLAFAINSVEPISLEVNHEGLINSLLSIPLILDVFILVYLLIRKEWSGKGFFGYLSKYKTWALAQLFSWIFSYFLYVVYTFVYIAYWLLPSFPYEGSLIIAMAVASSLLVLSNYGYYFLIGTAILEIIFSLPIGWKFMPNFSYQIPSGIISTSLLLLCITLVPYVKGKSSYSWVIWPAFAVSSIFTILGSFFSPPVFAKEMSSIGLFSLILVEYLSLKNVLSEFRLYFPLIMAGVLIMSILSTMVNYSSFYNLTADPSSISLFVSLSLGFPSLLLLYKGIRYYVIVSIGEIMIGYGIVSFLISISGIYLYATLLGSILPPFIALLISKLRLSQNKS